MVIKMTDQNVPGQVHIYSGHGKGKTTAALGLAIRAAGHGHKVKIIQFLKGSDNYGEIKSIKSLPQITLVQAGRPEHVDQKNPQPEDFEGIKKGMKLISEVMKESSDIDMLILDELITAIDLGLIHPDQVIKEIIEEKPEKMELIMTGRNAPPILVQKAAYVTEMLNIRHPYQHGIKARRGVEF